MRKEKKNNSVLICSLFTVDNLLLYSRLHIEFENSSKLKLRLLSSKDAT